MSRMRGWTALAMALMVSSCGTMKAPPPPLRVGVTPNYPPIIMLAGQKAAGVECDFAVQLASELGRPLELMPVPWDLQMDELEAGRTDIVMSGLTVTMARQARVVFCDPYMDNPLMAEVYTAPARMAPAVLVVEAPVTGSNCARPLAGQALRMVPGAAPAREALSFAMPGCDAVGDSLMLGLAPAPVPPVAMAADGN